MKKIRKIAAIGGIPDPIGGVTCFLSRLAAKNMVDIIIDIYPSKKKEYLAIFLEKYYS